MCIISSLGYLKIYIFFINIFLLSFSLLSKGRRMAYAQFIHEVHVSLHVVIEVAVYQFIKLEKKSYIMMTINLKIN